MNVLKILVIIVENKTCKILHDECIKYHNLLSNVQRLQWLRQCYSFAFPLCLVRWTFLWSAELHGGKFLLSALNWTETHLKQLKPCHFAKMIWGPTTTRLLVQWLGPWIWWECLPATRTKYISGLLPIGYHHNIQLYLQFKDHSHPALQETWISPTLISLHNRAQFSLKGK